jgi:hypothetical protein
VAVAQQLLSFAALKFLQAKNHFCLFKERRNYLYSELTVEALGNSKKEQEISFSGCGLR